MTAIPKAQPGSPGLWSRIETFSFDVGPTAYSFWARLASENGWSMSFAARAISEYRRFLYLAVVAGHQVSPSDDVDQVWHLHLLYTESYWNSCAATCSLCRCTITRRPAGHLNARSSTPGTGRLSKAIVACSLRIRRRISGRTRASRKRHRPISAGQHQALVDRSKAMVQKVAASGCFRSAEAPASQRMFCLRARSTDRFTRTSATSVSRNRWTPRTLMVAR